VILKSHFNPYKDTDTSFVSLKKSECKGETTIMKGLNKQLSLTKSECKGETTIMKGLNKQLESHLNQGGDAKMIDAENEDIEKLIVEEVHSKDENAEERDSDEVEELIVEEVHSEDENVEMTPSDTEVQEQHESDNEGH
jgi:hypothetical protein